MTAKKLTPSIAHGQTEPQAALPDVHSPGLLARHPVIGLIMFLFGGLIFGAMTYNLRSQGPLLAWDNLLANALPPWVLQSPPLVQSVVSAGFYVGDQLITVLTVLLGLYFIFKHLWENLALLTVSMVGASSLFLTLSHYFARPRPPTQIWIVLDIPGFPSGHAISTFVFYGLLAYLLVPKIRSVFWKAVVAAAALLIIVYVGFTRIATGGHYLTDILAGYAIGIAWAGVAFTLIELLSQKIRNRNVKKE